MIQLHTIDKSPRGEGCWSHGPLTYIDPNEIVAVEPREHSYHSFRPTQEYSVVHLRSGHSIEVWHHAKSVHAALEAAVEAK
jgi:hypothetical protein